jgi:hypothetical protein
MLLSQALPRRTAASSRRFQAGAVPGTGHARKTLKRLQAAVIDLAQSKSAFRQESRA